jgi:hypothetical protein
MTAARSRAPARSRSPVAGGQDAGGVQACQFRGAQGPPQPSGLVAGLLLMLWRQCAHEQVAFGGDPVVAGQLRGRTRARHLVGALRRHREHVRHVHVGTAGQGDVGVLAVLGAGDHGQAGVHGRPWAT